MGLTRMIFLAAILFTWGTIEALDPNSRIPNIANVAENPTVEVKRILPFVNPKEFKDGSNSHPVPKRQTVLGCGSYTLNPGTSVIIRSQNYPYNIPSWYSCQWNFQASSRISKISIFCPVFRLSWSWWYSYVHVGGGDFSHYYWWVNDCLRASSTTNSMTIFFSTTWAYAKGFECYVTASDATPPLAGCKCGHVNKNNRIVGGNPTEDHMYPWQVAITNTRNYNSYCGGSIISDQWILTASHCMEGAKPSGTLIVIGLHNWYDYETITERRKISQIVMHPDYNSERMDNDMALVKLQSPIEFRTDNKIAPVCLPPPGELYEDVDAIITGWGHHSPVSPRQDRLTELRESRSLSELYEVTVPTMSNDECKSYGYDYNVINTNMICAGFKEGGKDACQGDSGGPLITAGDAAQNFMVQIGVVSWGYGCAWENNPGVYARVNKYLDWIAKTTTGSATCPSL